MKTVPGKPEGPAAGVPERGAGARGPSPGEAWRDLGSRVRAADAWLADRLADGSVGFHVPAGAAGPALAVAGSVLSPGDWLVAGPREWPAVLGRGVPLPAFFHQVRGDGLDPQLGHASPLHYGDPDLGILPPGSPVGGRLTQAAGLGHAMRLKGARAATLCLLGESSCDENDFHTALNFAAVFQARTVFAVHAPAAPPPGRTTATIAEKGAAYGIPGVRADALDLGEVARVVGEALDRARDGAGPTLVELVVDEEAARAAGPGGDGEARVRAEREVRTAWRAVAGTPPPAASTLREAVWAERDGAGE